MKDLEKLLEKGRRSHQAGQIVQAVRTYRQILQAEPERADVLHLLGTALYQQDDLDGALDVFMIAIGLIS